MNNFNVQLSQNRRADVDQTRYNGKPVIRVFENGRLTPGQWFADTIAASQSERISIDYGANWELNANETAILKGFALGVIKALSGGIDR